MVNSETVSSQSWPRIQGLPDGGFVVVWTTSDPTQDVSGSAIKAQIFDATGMPNGGEFLVNSISQNTQNTPDVAVLANGDILFGWMSNDEIDDTDETSIKARVYDAANGTLGSEFLVNDVTLAGQNVPAVASLLNGGFVITWFTLDQTRDTDDYGIAAKVFGPGGSPQGTEFTVNDVTTNSQYLPRVATLNNGSFAITWDSLDQVDGQQSRGIKTKIFSEAGIPTGSEFLVNTTTTGAQTSSDIAALANGGFVVVWADSALQSEDASSEIRAQIFDGVGAKVGTEFPVNTQALADQNQPFVTGLKDGGFFVSWQTIDAAQDGDSSAIKGQFFGSSGFKNGDEILVNQKMTGSQ